MNAQLTMWVCVEKSKLQKLCQIGNHTKTFDENKVNKVHKLD